MGAILKCKKNLPGRYSYDFHVVWKTIVAIWLPGWAGADHQMISSPGEEAVATVVTVGGGNQPMLARGEGGNGGDG